jgi:hypothetical protein
VLLTSQYLDVSEDYNATIRRAELCNKSCLALKIETQSTSVFHNFTKYFKLHQHTCENFIFLRGSSTGIYVALLRDIQTVTVLRTSNLLIIGSFVRHD